MVNGKKNAINPAKRGTLASANYISEIPGGRSKTIYLRLVSNSSKKRILAINSNSNFDQNCQKVFDKRIKEADEFYAEIIPDNLEKDAQNIMRQSLAGMLWSKQFYNYSVRDWLKGDEPFPPPPESRKNGRNSEWAHLYNDDVISMPDKWEYPWYAAWDLAFHAIPLAILDAGFAKRQLLRLLREWYMHPQRTNSCV